MRRFGRTSPLRAFHMLCFTAGEAALALALLSPLETLSGTLLSAHMLQHVLLVAVAPPLIAAGRPDIAILACLQGRPIARSRAVRWLAAGWRKGERLLPATVLHAAAMWIWHAPPLFHAALDYPAVHDLEHLTFFLTALLFWRALLRASRSMRAAAMGALAALVTMIHMGFLGALITFAPRPIYSSYVGTELWGLSALEDQQIAGLIMWVPGGFVYLAAGLALASRLLSPAPRRAAADATAQATKDAQWT